MAFLGGRPLDFWDFLPKFEFPTSRYARNPLIGPRWAFDVGVIDDVKGHTGLHFCLDLCGIFPLEWLDVHFDFLKPLCLELRLTEQKKSKPVDKSIV